MEKWVGKAFEDMLPESTSNAELEGWCYYGPDNPVVEARLSSWQMRNISSHCKRQHLKRNIITVLYSEHFPSDAAALCVPQEASVACSTKIALEWDEEEHE
jgi:asparagine synthase (glutamine-hydrolysing)